MTEGGQLYQDFVFNKSSDFMQVELVAVYFLKLGRAQEASDWDAAEELDEWLKTGRDASNTAGQASGPGNS